MVEVLGVASALIAIVTAAYQTSQPLYHTIRGGHVEIHLGCGEQSERRLVLPSSFEL